jgi:two-component sensor histidine kinase
MQKQIAESEQRFNIMLNLIPDMISIHDSDMNILYSNWNGFGKVPKEKRILNTKCYKTYRNLDTLCPNCLAKNVFETKKSIKQDAKLPDGTWVELRIIPFLDDADKVTMFMEWVRNITKKKKAEEKIQLLLSEKEMLLHETHHRIKNNMMVLSSILQIEANKLKNEPKYQQILNDCANRFGSMMLLYEYLYKNEIKDEMNIQDYLQNLIEQLSEIFEHISLKTEVNIQEIYLTPKIVSKIGIIINELFTNSVKYALKSNDELIISISATKNDDIITLVFSDNGVGLPNSVSFENAKSFGLQLISMLVKDIRGKIKTEQKQGTKYIIEFKS